MAEVLHLFQMVARGEPVREFEEVFAVENKGLKDCLHGRSGSRRQVLLMDVETLEEFGIPPGRVKENITTRGIELSGLLAGTTHPRGRSAAGNHRLVHAVQPNGRNSGGAAGRTSRAARNIVPGSGTWKNSPRRVD